MANVNDVAAALLERTGSLDAFKFHKLVYYSQAWHLVWDDKPLFEERIEAWGGGPVCPKLYVQGQFKIAEWPHGDAHALVPTEVETVEAIVKSYGKMTTTQLQQLTRNERPWAEAREGLQPEERGERVIDLDVMWEYYGALDADPSAKPIK
jgi:uncharacterized phage-associated protein